MSRTLLYQAIAIGLAPVALPTGWPEQSSEIFAKPFSASEQQFQAWLPQVVISASNAKNAGWHPQSPDVFAKPFQAPEQQFSQDLPKRGNVPVAGTGQWFPQPPDLFVKPYLASE